LPWGITGEQAGYELYKSESFQSLDRMKRKINSQINPLMVKKINPAIPIFFR